jgi:arginyl-tRNA synthetase
MQPEVQRAAVEHKPLIITNLAYETARAFNDFYRQCPVLRAAPQKREFRLRIVTATRQVLADELRLLGITAPQVM